MPPRAQRRTAPARQLPTRTQAIVQKGKGKPAAAAAAPPVIKRPIWVAPAAKGGPVAVPDGVPQVSVCIATWNRWDFLKENLPHYLASPFVGEIVISDETGEDVAEIRRAYPDESRIICNVNRQRLGPFLNKQKAVELATNEWVCLIDSDNFAPAEYFVAWGNAAAQGLNPQAVYFPDRSLRTPNHAGFNYNVYGGVNVTKENMGAFYGKRGGAYLFNTANYFVNRTTYLAATHNPAIVKDGDTASSACHMMYKNYLLLLSGVQYHIVEGMSYYHVVHSGSLWKREALKTNLKLYMGLFRRPIA